jgi:hypothetical protein
LFRGGPLFACIACLLAIGSLCCGTAAAASLDDLYVARAIVTGSDERDRGRGFAEGLKEVVVKVSGDPRLRDEPRVAAMAENAGTFVADFDYRDRLAGIPIHDEQGSRDRPYDLTVRFDPAKIDAALRSLGREPWTAPRPRLVAFIGVVYETTAYVLARDGERGIDQREALADVAWELGMPVMLPHQASLTDIAAETLATADLANSDTRARETGGDLALTGSIVWSKAALGWVGEWRLAAGGKTYRWRISGVSFDDAFRNAVGGAAQILSGQGQPN